MASRKLVITVPPRLVQEPLVSRLVKEYDVMVNIMRANISPDEAGHLVVELQGTPEALDAGQAFMIGLGVKVVPLSSDVRWLEDRCVHCTACIAVCRVDALSVNRETMRVSFDSEKCIGCELCIPACSYNAMEIHL